MLRLRTGVGIIREVPTFALSPSQCVANERAETREPIRWIDVVFDDVKRKVIRAAEGPNRDSHQQRELQIGKHDQRHCGGHDPEEHEQAELNPQQSRVGNVGDGTSPK